MMKNEVIIKDNLLDDVHLTQLDELIHSKCNWFLQKEQTLGKDDGCWFQHIIYVEDMPTSALYEPVIKIFKNHLKYVSLCRITVNLLPRLQPPSISGFHTDFEPRRITTAIFYLNTNNGATEIEGGDRIDCVRNRLIMFPANTSHRAIGQTDVTKRIVFNFNFI